MSTVTTTATTLGSFTTLTQAWDSVAKQLTIDFGTAATSTQHVRISRTRSGVKTDAIAQVVGTPTGTNYHVYSVAGSGTIAKFDFQAQPSGPFAGQAIFSLPDQQDGDILHVEIDTTTTFSPDASLDADYDDGSSGGSTTFSVPQKTLGTLTSLTQSWDDVTKKLTVVFESASGTARRVTLRRVHDGQCELFGAIDSTTSSEYTTADTNDGRARFQTAPTTPATATTVFDLGGVQAGDGISITVSKTTYLDDAAMHSTYGTTETPGLTQQQSDAILRADAILDAITDGDGDATPYTLTDGFDPTGLATTADVNAARDATIARGDVAWVTGGGGLSTAESQQLSDILADTNELQGNQGNWITATGFATTADVNAARDATIARGDVAWVTGAGGSGGSVDEQAIIDGVVAGLSVITLTVDSSSGTVDGATLTVDQGDDYTTRPQIIHITSPDDLSAYNFVIAARPQGGGDAWAVRMPIEGSPGSHFATFDPASAITEAWSPGDYELRYRIQLAANKYHTIMRGRLTVRPFDTPEPPLDL